MSDYILYLVISSTPIQNKMDSSVQKFLNNVYGQRGLRLAGAFGHLDQCLPFRINRLQIIEVSQILIAEIFIRQTDASFCCSYMPLMV